jgi:Fur family transcriptional regulator, peroxide stress response regulator
VSVLPVSARVGGAARASTGGQEHPSQMTESDLDPQGLRADLEACGSRCTPQRLEVYAFLARSAHHPTAEEVFQGVRTRLPRISLATVYKALEAFVACGRAEKLTAGDGSARYDARSDRHYHARCLRSGSLHDLATPYDPHLIDKLDPELTDSLRRRGFLVTGYRLELIGFFEEAVEGGSRILADS